jgi:hypothetical protein
VKTQESFADDFKAVFQGSGNLFVETFANDKAIDDDFDRVVLVFVEFKFFGQIIDFVVDSKAAIAFGSNVVKEIGIVFIIDFENRRTDFNFCTFGQREYLFHELMRGPDLDFFLSEGAMGLPD